MTIRNIITQKARKITQKLECNLCWKALYTNLASSLITTSLELLITVTDFPFQKGHIYLGRLVEEALDLEPFL